ncbi:energy transducer TonB [Spirosoma pulveris]
MCYWRLLLLFVISHVSVAQTGSDDLNDDPVFTAVLSRRLKYPREAEWASVYGRVFAGFTVSEKGRVEDIAILNHSTKGMYYGFESTIIAALKKLPPLKLQYSGRYILPVAFIYVDYRDKNNPRVPSDVLYIDDLAGRIILKEINVFGSSVNSKERITSGERNESY